MTKSERKYPALLDKSRIARVARGCGRSVEDVEALHERFLQARQMMAGLGQMLGDPNAMARMQKMMANGQFPGMPGASTALERPVLSAQEKIELRKKQQEQRKARKKNH